LLRSGGHCRKANAKRQGDNERVEALHQAHLSVDRKTREDFGGRFLQARLGPMSRFAQQYLGGTVDRRQDNLGNFATAPTKFSSGPYKGLYSGGFGTITPETTGAVKDPNPPGGATRSDTGTTTLW
jgi:hypothetical protein